MQLTDTKVEYSGEYADPTVRYNRYLAFFNGFTTGILEDPAFEDRALEFLDEILKPRRVDGWARRESPITGRLAYHHPQFNRLFHQFLDQFKDLNPEVDRIVSPHEREFIYRPSGEESEVRQAWDDKRNAFFRGITSRERVEGWELVNEHDEHKPTHWRDPSYGARYHKVLSENGAGEFYPEGFSVFVPAVKKKEKDA